jgi:hypothetical protein
MILACADADLLYRDQLKEKDKELAQKTSVPGITVSGTPGILDLPTLGRTSHGKSQKLALLTTGTMMTMGKVCAPEYESIYIVCM